jgi:DNA-binding transcriptional ArsR family regulator
VDALSTTLAALSDPTRRAMLERLTAGPASVNELAAPFQMSQQAVSKHLAYLERACLIEKQRQGRQHLCRLLPAPIKEVVGWAERYRRFWEGGFDRLGELLREMEPQTVKEKESRDVRKKRKP